MKLQKVLMEDSKLQNDEMRYLFIDLDCALMHLIYIFVALLWDYIIYKKILHLFKQLLIYSIYLKKVLELGKNFNLFIQLHFFWINYSYFSDLSFYNVAIVSLPSTLEVFL